MKFEVRSSKCEKGVGVEVSNFKLHPSNFFPAIKRNFEELGA